MSDVANRLEKALTGRYAIGRELGSGGMAVVFLAEDLRHRRKVAIKVLHPELAAVVGTERFLREIDTIAGLAHPNILPLHDSGTADGLLYYTMPFVDGESLRQRLDREGQLPLDEALQITRQVADAIAHAHRVGIVHRDLKPANILFEAGHAVVADFGIARVVTAADGDRLTKTGIAHGTPSYMSPEQAGGATEVDGRSDIYALACVLYEMLAGEPPFTGSNAQVVASRVLTEEPEKLTLRRPTVPVRVETAVHRALQKLPADRFRSVEQFVAELDTTIPFASPSTTARGFLPSRWLPWALATFAVAWAVWAQLRSPPAVPTTRIQITLSGLTPGPAAGTNFDVSDDGRLIVYRGDEGNLMLKRMGELGARSLLMEGNPRSPSFSPDGRAVAYYDDALRSIGIEGGPAIDIADAGWPGVDWSDDGFIYFTNPDGGIARVLASGGATEALTTPNTQLEYQHRYPSALPGGNGVVFTIYRWPQLRSEIATLDLETGEVKILFRGVEAQYASSGHLLYRRSDGALLAVPFDPDRLAVVGAPMPAAEDLTDDFRVSSAGALLYVARTGSRRLVLRDRAGSEELVVDHASSVEFPRVSPDGRRLALQISSVDGIDIWTYGLADGVFTRLTFDGDNIYPAWSADGRFVLFARAETGAPGGNWSFFRVQSDGAGSPERVLNGAGSQVEIVELPDKSGIVYREGDVARGQGADIFSVAAGSAEPRRVAATRFTEQAPAVSPDSRWIAYVSNESGRAEVYVRPIVGDGGRRQISSDGGLEPGVG